MNIYLASPYSHPYESIRKFRFDMACKATAEIIQKGHVCFSPIVHSHSVAQYLNNPNDGEFWLNQDRGLLERWADAMWILMIKGYLVSVGIAKEMVIAKELRLPMRYYKIGESESLTLRELEER